ncbi:hypothetical protein EWB00_003896 [Schistosoma japonicum]|uniref:Uncharacterized protein n=1 Tax=Schistosoma japonicum TaxID=6182 RepID=A0A4Z2D712_SCHJA|nr:hypothetical protein EWB00_003896 [Schistosoma japonicum]
MSLFDPIEACHYSAERNYMHDILPRNGYLYIALSLMPLNAYMYLSTIQSEYFMSMFTKTLLKSD